MFPGISEIHGRVVASGLDRAGWLNIPFRLVLPTLLAAILGSGAGAQEMGLSVGSSAPAAMVEDLDGNPVQLLDYIGNGQPTLVEFWAHWCGQCRLLQPEMDRVHSTFEDRVNVVAVAIAVSQTPAQVSRHIQEHSPGYPYLFDRAGNAVRAYQVPGTAVVLIFDGEGKVVYSGTGGNQDLVGALEGILEG